MENVRNNFNALLTKKGISKAEFAEKLGLSRDTLYRRIRHNCDFTLDEIHRMFNIFGVNETLKTLFNVENCAKTQNEN